MLNSADSEEGVTDVFLVRFDFFHKSEYSKVTSHLQSKYGTKRDEYNDKHVIAYSRTGEYFTREKDISNSKSPSFSSLSTFLKQEIRIDKYRYKKLENFYYLVTVAQLSEEQMGDLNSSDSPRRKLDDWKEYVETFVKTPSIIDIDQSEIPTHTVIGFSGENPFHHRSREKQKEIAPEWIAWCNVHTKPRFFVFGFDPGKPSSILDQELIACAGDTPLESIFGVHFQGDRDTDSEHIEPALLEPLDHILLPTLVVFCGTWRINQIEKHYSNIEKLPEFQETDVNYSREIQRLNNLEDNWQNLHGAIKPELDEFDKLIRMYTSDRDFVRIPEIKIQEWGKRHIAVDNELNEHSMIEALYAYATGTRDQVRKILEETNGLQRQKSKVVDERVNREAHLSDEHWVKRPLVQIVLLVATLLGGVAATIQLLGMSAGFFSFPISDEIIKYDSGISELIYIFVAIFLVATILVLFRYIRATRQ